MYRLLFAILLIAQTFGFATVTAPRTSDPMPQCFPCPDGMR
jgi:hypothetical protein